jgi:hypothetical protein
MLLSKRRSKIAPLYLPTQVAEVAFVLLFSSEFHQTFPRKGQRVNYLIFANCLISVTLFSSTDVEP